MQTSMTSICSLVNSPNVNEAIVPGLMVTGSMTLIDLYSVVMASNGSSECVMVAALGFDEMESIKQSVRFINSAMVPHCSWH